MPNGEFAGAYTNMPERVGTEYAPGEPWQYVGEPQEEMYEPYDIGIVPQPPGPKPPSGWMKPDFSRRDDFEQSVFNQIGGNPFKMNPNDVEKQVLGDLPRLFQYVFGGRLSWSQRGRMTPDQRKYWEDSVAQYRQEQQSKFTLKQQHLQQQHKWMMERFDNEAKQYQDALERYRGRLKEARQYKFLYAGRGKAKGPGDIKLSDMRSLSEFEAKHINAAVHQGLEIPQNIIDQANAMRQILGWPMWTKRSMTPEELEAMQNATERSIPQKMLDWWLDREPLKKGTEKYELTPQYGAMPEQAATPDIGQRPDIRHANGMIFQRIDGGWQRIK